MKNELEKIRKEVAVAWFKALLRPYHGSGGYSLAFHRGGPGPLQGQAM
jgi:hypothetical protein